MKREINSTENYRPQIYNNKCQASINSDGMITLRIYDIKNEGKDEIIIILSEDETNAIFETKVETSEYELYKKFKDKYNIIKGLEVNDNWL